MPASLRHAFCAYFLLQTSRWMARSRPLPSPCQRSASCWTSCLRQIRCCSTRCLKANTVHASLHARQRLLGTSTVVANKLRASAPELLRFAGGSLGRRMCGGLACAARAVPRHAPCIACYLCITHRPPPLPLVCLQVREFVTRELAQRLRPELEAAVKANDSGKLGYKAQLRRGGNRQQVGGCQLEAGGPDGGACQRGARQQDTCRWDKAVCTLTRARRTGLAVRIARPHHLRTRVPNVNKRS